jgi:integrase
VSSTHQPVVFLPRCCGNPDFKTRTLSVREKGGLVHAYQISREGLQAIRNYIDKERDEDDLRHFAALFLPASNNTNAKPRLSPQTINHAWNAVCHYAGVVGRTPHSARHAMGRHLVEKTGNIAAVQRQLGHKNAAYSMQYARITRAELNQKLDERG